MNESTTKPSIMDELEAALESASLYRLMCIEIQTTNKLLEKEICILHQALRAVSPQAHKLIQIEIDRVCYRTKENLNESN